ncbi:MAG: uncharacterized protein QOJ94_2444 [Sphingomonadales bacterium]|nr:uncharacterized protein [Sphingomonadales bacterium]MEA3062663.1 uncharacterized protein [Sphingomonadales bacterium]
MPPFSAPRLGPGAVHCEALDALFRAHPDLIRVAEIEPSSGWIKAPGPRGAVRSNGFALEEAFNLPQAKLVHGIGWPIGGTVCPDGGAWAEQRRWAERLDAPWTSEHLSFNDSPAGPAGFLLPPAQTQAGVAVATANIRARTEALGRPFAFETGVNYLPPRPGEMPDGDFFAAVAEEADCLILLDLHNLWANARNGRDPVERVLAALPFDRVIELHLAGGMEKDGYWLDAHSGPVPPGLLDLARDLVAALPNVGAVLFEISPQFVDALGPAAFLREMEAMNDLWERTGHRAVASRPWVAPPRAAADDSPSAYEQALVALLTGPASPGEPPAIALYRTLIASFRNGALSDLLPNTLRLLARRLGEAALEEMLAAYRLAAPPSLFPSDEALAFAAWLDANGPRLDYLEDLLELEAGIVRFAGEGAGGELRFRHDPSAVLDALAAGSVPEGLPKGDYRLVLHADAMATASEPAAA